jgi:hypothetical protein
MGSFGTYRARYPSVFMSRDGRGILGVVLHTKGGSLRWSFDVIANIKRQVLDLASLGLMMASGKAGRLAVGAKGLSYNYQHRTRGEGHAGSYPAIVAG